MPFWWRRRQKPWFGRRFRYKTRRRWRTRRRRQPRRRRYRRPTYGRRRRRKRKVRRKKKRIAITQWQPDSITKCKIKGGGILVLGAQGRQMYCYTDVKDETVRPRTPCGGGFGIEVYNLKYLYEEYKLHNNIWTKTNILKDLCRYLWCKFTFYRHPLVDFVLGYDRQPPFQLSKLTYPSTHPHQLIQSRHKKFLLSTKTNPNGKLTKKFFIKPPKQMISKWFFSQAFCKYPLVEIRAAATDLKSSYLGPAAENQQLGLFYLNQQFYDTASWGKYKDTPYLPYLKTKTQFKVWYIGENLNTGGHTVTIDTSSYDHSVNYSTGWFQSAFLRAVKIENQATLPVNTTLYNPNLDNGTNSMVYVTSIQTDTYEAPTKDPDVVIVGLPIWLALYGYLNYLIETKKTKEYLTTHCVMLKSPGFQGFSQIGLQTSLLVIDKAFIEGKAAFDQPPTFHDKQYWYPTIHAQLNSLNSIVECGPYIPKLWKQTYSNWELKYSYNFCFKWGGPLVTDAEVADPCKQPTHDVPDHLQGTVQIQNPEKIKTESLIQPWDIRRGIIKETALKRMYDNLSIDTAFQPDALCQEPPQKKRYLPKITQQKEENQALLTCLRSLCQESTSEEDQQKTLEELIHQQRHKQHKLKRHLLELLSNMKHHQQMLQLQTGLLD
nr:MAG: ORF1 [Torque teno midi virus]